jgi:hypothetical protein
MRVFSALISLVAAAMLPVVAAWVAGCNSLGSPAVRGSGVVGTETRELSGFTEIRLSGTGEVTVEQGDTESLTVEAEDNILPLLESRVIDGRLMLGARDNVSVRPTRPIRYRVTLKELTGLGVSGSGSFKVQGVDTPRLAADISGSGSAKLAGRADDVRLSISGSGDYDAAGLASQTAEVVISGSGSATVNTSRRLVAKVSGSGSVHYLGDPTIEQHVSGSGSVKRHRRTDAGVEK